MKTKYPGQVIAATIAGACFVIVTQLATLDSLSSSLRASVILCSIAIPLLLFVSIYDPFASGHATTPHLVTWMVVLFISSFVGIAGVCSLFFHFGCLPGWIFSVLSGLLLAFELGRIALMKKRS
jgi:hypothetical protein